MPTNEKSVKRKKGKKIAKSKKKSKPSKKMKIVGQQRTPITELTEEERKKKVIFRGQTISLQEQYALEDLEKELNWKIGKFSRIEYRQFEFLAQIVMS